MNGPDEKNPLESDELAPLPAAKSVPPLDGLAEDAERNRVFEALFQIPTEPSMLGRYVILGTLGQGGMGTVLEAFDRTLDRRVALKVLHRSLDAKHTKRLLREAQAMAKLSHPNVAQVYEATEMGQQTFIAMELVQGQTLRRWMHRDPRPSWQDCVKVFMQAGAGLAAAHERGLIHRDFKPGNAIVDDDGCAKVLDFGLARTMSREGEHAEHASSMRAKLGGLSSSTTRLEGLDASLTETGAVMGTPAYMPLEQMLGDEADARSDQFSFCVALYEAVYGQRPFPGSSLAALMVTVSEGSIEPAPRGTKVPPTLRQILLRGLAARPDERWPSMEVLLAELGRLVTPRGRRWLVPGLTAGLVAIGVGLGVESYTEVMRRCTGAEEQLADVWSDARQDEVEDAILGTEVSYAADTWERVEQGLDAYAAAWAAKHEEVCTATNVRQEQSVEVMDLRMDCLRTRRSSLRATVDVLGQLDAKTVENALDVVNSLPRLSRCDDVEALRATVPPPEDPETARRVEQLREQLLQARALADAGDYAGSTALADTVVQEAKALGYGPLLAEALESRGTVADLNGQSSLAKEALEHAYHLALQHSSIELELDTASVLLWITGYKQPQRDEAERWRNVIMALLQRRTTGPEAKARAFVILGNVFNFRGEGERALEYYHQALEFEERALGPDHLAVANVLSNIGNTLADRGELQEALDHYLRSFSILEQTLGAHHPRLASAMSNIGTALIEQGKFEEALEYHRRSISIREQALGPRHPEVGISLLNIGNVLYMTGRLDEALDHYRRAMSIYEDAYGHEHTVIADLLNNIGSILTDKGEFELALDHHRRSLDMGTRLRGPDHIRVTRSLNNIGNVLAIKGELPGALEYFERALASRERAAGPDHFSVAESSNNIANVLLELERVPEAVESYQRAIRIWEDALGREHPDLAYPLIGLATAALQQGEPRRARLHAQRAVAVLEASGVASALLETAQFLLAQALWSDRAQRPTARALAERAREGFAEHGDAQADDRAEVERWLVEHTVR